MSFRILALAAALCGAAVVSVPAQQTTPPDSTGPETVRYTPSRGTVTFSHAKHAKAAECVSCHHESRTERPNTKPRQACGDCHVAEPVAPMTTTLRLAFHNTAARSGVCFDCHKKEVEAGKDVPVGCLDCHKR